MTADPTLDLPLGRLPLFPLPKAVLFPDQRLALHIFEPRYRQMVRDAIDGHPYLVITMIDGDPDAEPSRFMPIATIGRIVTHHRLADGRYNIVVHGVSRARVDEIDSTRLYRQVRADVLPEPDVHEQPVPVRERMAMMSAVTAVSTAHRRLDARFELAAPPFSDLARVAFHVGERLVHDGMSRQSILEAATTLARVRATTAALASVLSELSTVPRGASS